MPYDVYCMHDYPKFTLHGLATKDVVFLQRIGVLMTTSLTFFLFTFHSLLHYGN